MKNITVTLNDLMTIVVNGELGQRLRAVETIESLMALGIVKDQEWSEAIQFLRLMAYADAPADTKGIYLARILGGEYADQICIGITENWISSYETLRSNYGATWLFTFIALENANDTTYTEWEIYIRNIVSKNIINGTDRFYLSERNTMLLLEHLRTINSDNNLNANIIISPMLRDSKNGVTNNWQEILAKIGYNYNYNKTDVAAAPVYDRYAINTAPNYNQPVAATTVTSPTVPNVTALNNRYALRPASQPEPNSGQDLWLTGGTPVTNNQTGRKKIFGKW